MGSRLVRDLHHGVLRRRRPGAPGHQLLREVALRLDTSGITLGSSPLRYRATTRFDPWEHVENAGGAFARRTGQAVVPHVPAEIVQASVAVNGWTFDKDELTTSVKGFAPEVDVVGGR